jgi:hypothetical protein
MIYMCISAFGIINGLVGIFGTAFTRASESAFHDMSEIHHQLALQNMQQQQQAQQLGSGGGGGGSSGSRSGSDRDSGSESAGSDSDDQDDGHASQGENENENESKQDESKDGDGGHADAEAIDIEQGNNNKKVREKGKEREKEHETKQRKGVSPLPKRNRSFLDPLGVLNGGGERRTSGGDRSVTSTTPAVTGPIIAPPRRVLNYEHVQLLKAPLHSEHSRRRLSGESVMSLPGRGGGGGGGGGTHATKGVSSLTGIEKRRSFEDLFPDHHNNSPIGGVSSSGGLFLSNDLFDGKIGGGGHQMNQHAKKPAGGGGVGGQGTGSKGHRRSSSLLASDPLLELQFNQLRNDVTHLLHLQKTLTQEISMLRNVADTYTGVPNTSSSGPGGNKGTGPHGKQMKSTSANAKTLLQPTSSSLKKRASQQKVDFNSTSSSLKGLTNTNTQKRTSVRRISIGGRMASGNNGKDPTTRMHSFVPFLTLFSSVVFSLYRRSQ